MTREEAIKVLEAEKKFLFHGSLSDKHYEPAFDMAIEALKEQKTGKWIPVSERLPKAGEYIGDVEKYYLVQNEYGDMLVASYTHGEYWVQIYQLKPIGDDIVAWMPLPEPYKEDNMEDNHYKMGKMLADNFYNGVSFWREYADKRGEEICKDYTESEDKE